ncbi:MAG: hypothetical protein JNJ83_11050 [Verrucomicrobiaceae bacterium]|nr:hypothetical protein [Verrucomicrobiaceae bacterium]
MALTSAGSEHFGRGHGPCPGCGGKDRFRFDDKAGDGTFICSQGGGGTLSGNGLTLLQHITGWDFKRSIEELGSYLLSEDQRVRYAGQSVAGGDRRETPSADLPAEPKSDNVEVPAYDEGKLRAFVSHVGRFGRDDLRALSPIKDLGKVPACDFFDALYADDEKVLVFDNYYSQGDYLYWVGKANSYRLSQERGVKAVKSPLVNTGKNGVWYLCNPVSGQWEPKEQRTVWKHVPRGHHGPPHVQTVPGEWSRRHWPCVTSWRYAVLESDTAPEDLWIKALYKLPLPIVAIYSSAGKSLHALLRIDAGSKLEWDLCMRGKNDGVKGRSASLIHAVCPLGGDPNALTGVRLTRLPNAFREGSMNAERKWQRYQQPRLQELVYLNPVPLSRKVPWKSLEMGGAR